jgi:hypothetical protein
MQLNARDIALVNSLVTCYYDVVPHEYKTYCALTACITQSVLKHFGLDAKLLPCQVWLVTEEKNFVVGFLGKANPRKWDGHVVCRAGNLIVDAALKHFEKEFGLNVPSIASTSCFNVPTQVIACCDLSKGARFWWHYPPATPGIQLNVPDEPQDVIAKFATQLIERLASTGIVRDISSPRGTTLGTAADTSNS